jgi:hypothetical protein
LDQDQLNIVKFGRWPFDIAFPLMDLAYSVLSSAMPVFAGVWEGPTPEKAFPAMACVLAQAA